MPGGGNGAAPWHTLWPQNLGAGHMDGTRTSGPAADARPGRGWAEYDIHTERTGQGPTLVLTHGFGDSTEVWRDLVPTLSASYTVLNWDLLGHGQSAKPEVEEPYHSDRAVAELKRIVDVAGTPAVLVGHSVGGYLSQRFVLRYPDLVRAVVLLNTGPGYRKPEARRQWNEQAQARIDRYDVPTAAWRLLEQHDSFVMDHLQELGPPAFVLCGERDKGYVHAMELYARKIPDVETLIMPGAGHNPHKTHGAAVADAVHGFLERRLSVPGRGPGGM